uniref:Uncharacterized protein n=1 Tax=Phlegmariurus squarrosus TaxID=73615 RepID=H9M887_PHLSQ|nr:hypothetical protein HusqMp31 [Phlegmariurus squarrosus]YP_006234353.1 hypothetical protein HusqMp113 [Phlegmariurus squarrosus]AEV55745.1 hypothetical protein HusqMp31 [Phlegmariurus squarrosus]AEV55794.1 hypothetical protein HusqMp113 [Phlegmariurus squarrosus]
MSLTLLVGVSVFGRTMVYNKIISKPELGSVPPPGKECVYITPPMVLAKAPSEAKFPVIIPTTLRGFSINTAKMSGESLYSPSALLSPIPLLGGQTWEYGAVSVPYFPAAARPDPYSPAAARPEAPLLLLKFGATPRLLEKQSSPYSHFRHFSREQFKILLVFL